MISADFAEFLDALGGRVTGGPTELGRYTIELDDGVDIADVIAALTADSRVWFVGRAFTASESGGAEEP